MTGETDKTQPPAIVTEQVTVYLPPIKVMPTMWAEGAERGPTARPKGKSNAMSAIILPFPNAQAREKAFIRLIKAQHDHRRAREERVEDEMAVIAYRQTLDALERAELWARLMGVTGVTGRL